MRTSAEAGQTSDGTVYVASRLVADPEYVFAPGAVAVANGIVLAAGPKDDILRMAPSSFAVRELPGAAILPGLVNAHTHLQIPRLTDPAGQPLPIPPNFVDWLLQVIVWRMQAYPSSFAGNFAEATREAISFGTTSAGEIAGPDLTVYSSCPLRARVFAEGIGFAPEAAPAVLEAVGESIRQLEVLSAVNPLLAPGVSPHTLYTVGEGLLRSLAALASGKKLPVCLHLAESAAEMEFLSRGGGEIATRLYPFVGQDVSSFRGIGRSIPGHLSATGLLREGLLLAHNVHLAAGQIDALRAAGARFVLCPRSNEAHGNGAPDVTHFVDAGIPFALGTDSLGSVPDLDLWEESRRARSLYRGKMGDAALCRELFRALTVNGAAALALPTGTLAQGVPADFVAVDDPGGEGAEIFVRLVEGTQRSNVRLTVVGGRPVHGDAA
ncbi:MAG: amidohydrolase family protein [Thermodesulfobacteriota bacterium]